ncbi:hypothetical protein DOTSEDRAFT_29790 [Dothistroma septosporum NZE10]|uniref:Uncharacterized protein n=1 Tax=Dothistroma septosporum (strain NZE10 / CBS 128990) TaxID=675120 RepID=N1PY13_DOTSN|nr:hypothetical protein DOTSEDRAFT_29790 [Dothistroma septosporum NZE10]
MSPVANSWTLDLSVAKASWTLTTSKFEDACATCAKAPAIAVYMEIAPGTKTEKIQRKSYRHCETRVESMCWSRAASGAHRMVKKAMIRSTSTVPTSSPYHLPNCANFTTLHHPAIGVPSSKTVLDHISNDIATTYLQVSLLGVPGELRNSTLMTTVYELVVADITDIHISPRTEVPFLLRSSRRTVRNVSEWYTVGKVVDCTATLRHEFVSILQSPSTRPLRIEAAIQNYDFQHLLGRLGNYGAKHTAIYKHDRQPNCAIHIQLRRDYEWHTEQDYLQSIKTFFAPRDVLEDALHNTGSRSLQDWLDKSGIADLIFEQEKANTTFLAGFATYDPNRGVRVERMMSGTRGVAHDSGEWEELVLQDVLRASKDSVRVGRRAWMGN